MQRHSPIFLSKSGFTNRALVQYKQLPEKGVVPRKRRPYLTLEKTEMKKTLVALAALASVSAFAQSSVTITGLVDMAATRIDYKGNVVTTTGAPNGSATSNFTFLINEDLGGGLKADARWEIDPDLTQTVGKTSGTSSTGTTSNVTSFLGNGYSFLGLSGGFGSVKFGTINYETLAANGDGNQGLGTAIGSGYRVTSFDAVRAQNSFRYDTPNMNGFVISGFLSEKNNLQANAYSTGLTGNEVNQTNGRDKNTEFALAYNNGPLTARYAALTTEQWGAIATTFTTDKAAAFTPSAWTAGTGASFKLNTLSVKYDINTAYSVSYFNQIAKSDALTVTDSNAASTSIYDRKTNGVAASYTNGPGKFIINYQTATNGDSATSATVSKKGLSTKVLGLGYDFSLSKRSVAYVRYEKDTDGIGARSTTGYTAATGNTTYTATAVGIRHTF